MKKKVFNIICLVCVTVLCVDIYTINKENISCTSAYWLVGVPIIILIGSILLHGKNNESDDEMVLDKEFASFVSLVGKDALEGKKGGYYIEKSYLANSLDVCRSASTVGVIPPDERQVYRLKTKEKINRLMRNILFNMHRTSYESRDENPSGEWGGAVIINRFIIGSFEGFPELLNEAFVCWVALQRRTMTKKNFKKICKLRANNPWLHKIMQHISK